jgi:predicted amidohydrolase YtcJ
MDVILTGGSIVTMSGDGDAEAVGVSGGRSAVG